MIKTYLPDLKCNDWKQKKMVGWSDFYWISTIVCYLLLNPVYIYAYVYIYVCIYDF